MTDREPSEREREIEREADRREIRREMEGGKEPGKSRFRKGRTPIAGRAGSR